MLDVLCDDCRAHFDQLQSCLKAAGIPTAMKGGSRFAVCASLEVDLIASATVAASSFTSGDAAASSQVMSVALGASVAQSAHTRTPRTFRSGTGGRM